VWLTIGFFEVEKDAAGNYKDTWSPAPLAAEIGKAENRHVRYRTFAIVDRTQLQVWPTMDWNNPAVAGIPGEPLTADPTKHVNIPTGTPTIDGRPTGAPAAPFTHDINLVGSAVPPNDITGFTDAPWRSNRTWTLQDGAVLVYDPGSDNEETVVV